MNLIHAGVVTMSAVCYLSCMWLAAWEFVIPLIVEIWKTLFLFYCSWILFHLSCLLP